MGTVIIIHRWFGELILPMFLLAAAIWFTVTWKRESWPGRPAKIFNGAGCRCGGQPGRSPQQESGRPGLLSTFGISGADPGNGSHRRIGGPSRMIENWRFEMIITWMVAAIHLLALGIGLGAIWTRARALKGLPNLVNLRRAFIADSLWAVAAALWISTGLARAFLGLEKGSAYYLNNNAFWIKMALLVLILLLEIKPMITLIHWRMQVSRGEEIDPQPANGFAVISVVQAGLVVAMVFVATAMARGIGA